MKLLNHWVNSINYRSAIHSFDSSLIHCFSFICSLHQLSFYYILLWCISPRTLGNKLWCTIFWPTLLTFPSNTYVLNQINTPKLSLNNGMTSHFTLYDVINHHDVKWIVLECCSGDLYVAVGCIPTLLLKKKKYSNKYIFISYILSWNDIKSLNSRI